MNLFSLQRWNVVINLRLRLKEGFRSPLTYMVRTVYSLHLLFFDKSA